VNLRFLSAFLDLQGFFVGVLYVVVMECILQEHMSAGEGAAIGLFPQFRSHRGLGTWSAGGISLGALDTSLLW